MNVFWRKLHKSAFQNDKVPLFTLHFLTLLYLVSIHLNNKNLCPTKFSKVFTFISCQTKSWKLCTFHGCSLPHVPLSLAFSRKGVTRKYHLKVFDEEKNKSLEFELQNTIRPEEKEYLLYVFISLWLSFSEFHRRSTLIQLKDAMASLLFELLFKMTLILTKNISSRRDFFTMKCFSNGQ